ncbi:MAG: acyl-CoA dehydrogenase C-terminal domain-containing protein, partial [Caulobacteraceae bacterium]
MFVMMNEARIGVGLQGVAQGEAAYQAARDFALDRLQGRSLTGPKNPDGPADPIIVHPDVRRMLLDSRAMLEAGRAFLFWTALHGDLSHGHPDEAVRQKGADYMGLLTPVLKGYLTDKGFKACVDGMQVHGGSGFTEHFPASQYLRDCRIALIYEGTNGIQALDLVGRKLPAKGGRAIMAFLADCDAYATELDGDEALKPFADGLRSSKGQLQDATMWLMQNGMQNPDNAGAAAHDYLNLMALTCMAWSWGMIAKAAQGKIAAGDADAFYANKLATGSYFLERILPEAAMHLAKIKSGAAPVMALPAKAF